MTGGLTPQQSNLLLFIQKYTFENNHVSPTYDEMASHLGLKAKSNVFRIVTALRRRGFISFPKNRKRSIQIINPIVENNDSIKSLFNQLDWDDLVRVCNSRDIQIREYIAEAVMHTVEFDLESVE